MFGRRTQQAAHRRAAEDLALAHLHLQEAQRRNDDTEIELAFAQSQYDDALQREHAAWEDWMGPDT